MENTKELLEIANRLSQIAIELQSKQPFKDGDVVEYIKKDGKSAIIKITNSEKGFGYGISNSEWIIKDLETFKKECSAWSFKYSPHEWQLATDKEWLDVCIKEAEKRYKVGDKVLRPDSFVNNGIVIIESGLSTGFLNNNKNMFQFHGNQVMQAGIWATVIAKDKTLEELYSRYMHNDDYGGGYEINKWIEDNKEAYIKAIQNLKKDNGN